MNKVIYLAGSMEYSEDEGLAWRKTYEKSFKEIGIDSIIPNEIERPFKEDLDFKDLKENNVEKYIEIIRMIIDQDLKFVESVDMIVVRWEGEMSAGTMHEVGFAYQLQKPVYLISSLPCKNVPGWFLACCTKKLSSLEELIEFLKEEK